MQVTTISAFRANIKQYYDNVRKHPINHVY